jgi:hypothetical protein
VDGFYSLYLRQMNDIIYRLYFGSTNDSPGLKDFMNVSQTSNPTNEMEWIARPACMPLVTGGQQPVFMDDNTTLNVLFEPAFDGRKIVCLPLDAKPIVRSAGSDGVKIAPLNFSAQRVGFQIEASAPAMVVVAQAFYHPWHAYVDGAPVRLWRANYAFQALEAPAGKHRVELVYEDKMFRAGSAISLAALFGCGVAWIFARAARKIPTALDQGC